MFPTLKLTGTHKLTLQTSQNPLQTRLTSDVDTISSNLDPDTEFWQDLDPDSRVIIKVLNKNVKNNTGRVQTNFFVR